MLGLLQGSGWGQGSGAKLEWGVLEACRWELGSVGVEGAELEWEWVSGLGWVWVSGLELEQVWVSELELEQVWVSELELEWVSAWVWVLGSELLRQV
ncbi:MAG: hypothetical protein Q6M04_08875 [Thermostichus sp. BF3_bins_97]